MAAQGRSGETSTMNENIYDNNAKEIDPAKVRAVITALIESNFNLVDDFLKDLNYSAGVTLENAISAPPLVGTVTGINVGENDSYGVTGIISSTNVLDSNGVDSNIEINLSQSIAGKIIIPTLYYTSGNYNSNNDICMPVLRVISSTKITVGLRKMASVGTSITLQLAFF